MIGGQENLGGIRETSGVQVRVTDRNAADNEKKTGDASMRCKEIWMHECDADDENEVKRKEIKKKARRAMDDDDSNVKCTGMRVCMMKDDE